MNDHRSVDGVIICQSWDRQLIVGMKIIIWCNHYWLLINGQVLLSLPIITEDEIIIIRQFIIIGIIHK